MKKLLLMVLSVAIVAGTYSCVSDNSDVQQSKELSKEVQNKIKALGFSAENAVATENGYLVEGDIILTDNELESLTHADHKHLIIAKEEQYRTTNLVGNLPRTITISVSGTVNQGFSDAVDNAITRYNNENLGITFSRVSSGGNIVIKIVNTGQYIASAGFPSGGNPYPTVNYAKKYTSGYSNGFMTTVIAHEVGHCIGFRHTDYMNRSYSCGTGGNEGDGGVGAINIPGTPTGPDAASWMLACLGASTDRPFNANDKVALNYLY